MDRPVVQLELPLEDEPHMPSKPSDRQVGGGHYKDLKIQPGFFSESNKLTHMRGEAIDYIVRSQVGGGEKKDPVKDLLKAIHCIELVLEWEYSYVRTKDTITRHRD